MHAELAFPPYRSGSIRPLSRPNRSLEDSLSIAFLGSISASACVPLVLGLYTLNQRGQETTTRGTAGRARDDCW